MGALAFTAAPAFAGTGHEFTASFGSEGSGAGQLKEPAGVAVNDKTDDVYVVDRGNSRIDEFEAGGTFVRAWGWGVAEVGKEEKLQTCTVLTGCATGSAGPGAGQLDSAEAIAVDNSGSASDPSKEDVYVTNTADNVVEKFSSTGAYLSQLTETTGGSLFGGLLGVAVDPLGNVWVYDSNGNVDEFSDTGSFVKTFNTGRGAQQGLAVDSNDDVYATCCGTEVGKFDPTTGAQLAEFGGGGTSALAIDPATNDLFVDKASSIREYGPFGEPYAAPIQEFGSVQLSGGGGRGIAIDSATGAVYVADAVGDRVDVFTAGPTPEAPETKSASGETPSEATLNGVLNPKGATGALEYQFDYNKGASCLGGQSVPVPAGEKSEAKEALVEAKLSGLEPSTKYTYCLVATNSFGRTQGNEVPFETKAAPPTVVEPPTISVTPTGAHLEGLVNPNNQVTECHVQYGTEALLLSSTTLPCEPETLEGFSNQGALTLSGLTQDTTYYYRVIAKNAAHEETRSAAIEHFTTTTPEPPTTLKAEPVAATEATLNGVLNPKHAGTAGTYEFRYRKSATECQGGQPGPEEEKATTSTGAAGGKEEAVPTPVTGLEPDTTYTFCLLAKNAAEEPALGKPETFTTLALPPTIEPESESVTEVTASSAKLHAEIDPGARETTYRFEYGTSAAYGQSTPASAPIGSDSTAGESPAVAAIQGLQPGTTYHYRVVATNSQSPGGTPGPDRTFITQAVGGEFALPDGRAYELVSPVQKDGAEVLGIGSVTAAGGDATQASEDGTGVTYIATAAVGVSSPGNLLSAQVLSRRGPGGWSSQNISIPHKHAINIDHVLGEGEEYRRFSSDLARAVVVSPHTKLEPPLAPELHQEVRGGLRSGNEYLNDEIYLRNDDTGAFQALLTTEPLVPGVEFEGATPDLSHVVFEGPAGLDPHYPHAGGLYEWAGGQTQLVDVLPKGEPATGVSLLASMSINEYGQLRESATRHAISNDGMRVVWKAAETSFGSYYLTGPLFTRDMATGATVQVDAAEPGCVSCVSGDGQFLAASSDGSRVFFTDTNELTSGAHGGGLFMFDVTQGRLTDLTPAATGAQLTSFFGADEEGTSLYEVSSAVLTDVPNSQGQTATTAASNLYLLRETTAGSGSWRATFVTAGAGGPDVSPNGRYLAFMSQQSLTGYDNRDANSGQPDEEVYLYDAEANRLVCASCDPTGARPVGPASIPGITPDGCCVTTGYQPRSLSDSGRLFFDSFDALVPQDVNGKEDVYEYEPAGEGSCQPPSYGQSSSDVFNASAGGCNGLISAGTGAGDSVFFDASASGGDVFFTTSDGLVPQDADGAADMYDARVCTGSEPCPSSLAASPACTTTDSCRVAPSPQPDVFAAPASATFAGAGNAPPPTVAKKTTKKSVKCKKGFAKNKKGKCVKKPKKKSKRAKKAGHNGRAK